MSYILDALKRAEQERQYGQLPNATTAPMADQGRDSARWPWIVIAVLLLACAAATASYWFASRGAPSLHSTQATADTTKSPATVTSLPPAVRPIAPVFTQAPQLSATALPTRVKATTTHPVILAAPATPKPSPTFTKVAQSQEPAPSPAPKPEPSREKSSIENQAIEPAAAKPATNVVAENPEENDSYSLPWLNEMPNDYRQAVPNIEIQFHRHTDSRSSNFVMIDGQRYRDGDILKSGPTLERIVEEGLVLYWRSKRFVYPIGG